MTVEQAYNRVSFRGDACLPAEGEVDLRAAVATTVSRLPADVQDWLLDETSHVFFGMQGQHGEHFDLLLFPDFMEKAADGGVLLRVVMLSETLAKCEPEEVYWTIAHEIAHSRLNHDAGGHANEEAADKLAGSWGFHEPERRAAQRDRMKF